jgi:hypothetical protein
MNAIIIFAAVHPLPSGKPHAFSRAVGPFVDFRDADSYLTERGFEQLGESVCYRGKDHLLHEEIFSGGEDRPPEECIDCIATLNILSSPM